MKKSYNSYLNTLAKELHKVNLSLNTLLYSFSPLKATSSLVRSTRSGVERAYEYGVSAVCLANWIHGIGQADNLSPEARIEALNSIIERQSPSALQEMAESEGWDD